MYEFIKLVNKTADKTVRPLLINGSNYQNYGGGNEGANNNAN